MLDYPKIKRPQQQEVITGLTVIGNYLHIFFFLVLKLLTPRVLEVGEVDGEADR